MAIFVSGGHLNMNIEENVQSLTVTSSLTSSKLKTVFSKVISDDLSIPDVRMSLSEIFRNFQNGRHFDVQAIFLTGSCTGNAVLHRDRPCHSLYFEVLFDVLAQILTELWLFQNLTYFFTSWPSYLTFDLGKLYSSVPDQVPHVDEVWWLLAKNCGLYRDTNRQTNKWKGNRRLHTCQNYLTELETETWLIYPHSHVYILHFSFCLV